MARRRANIILLGLIPGAGVLALRGAWSVEARESDRLGPSSPDDGWH
jgi:hypothetical protein